MLKRTLLFFAFLLFVNVLLAQSPTTTFLRAFKPSSLGVGDTTSYLFLKSITPTNDCGYAILGDVAKSGFGQTDIVVMKTDSLGNIKWAQRYGNDTSEISGAIRNIGDGYIFCGYTSLPNSSLLGDLLVTKITGNGKLEWSAQFGQPDVGETAKGIAVLNNGITITASNSEGFPTRGFVLTTQANGTPDNGLFLQAGEGGRFAAAETTFDNGAIVVGQAGEFFERSRYDPFIVKFNNKGERVWAKRHAIEATQFTFAAKQVRDSGIVLCGNYSNITTNVDGIFMMKTNSKGDYLWAKVFQTPTLARKATIITEVSDGYIMGGEIGGFDTLKLKDLQGRDSLIFPRTPFLMKTDKLGKFLWAKRYADSTKSTSLEGITQAKDGGVTCVGITYAYGNKYGGGFMLHVDKDGVLNNSDCKPRSFTLPLALGGFVVADSTNFLETEGGDQRLSSNQMDTFRVVSNTICTGTGVFTVSIDDFRLPESAIKIYPNPTRDELFVEMLTGNKAQAKVSIFDLTGRMIHTEKTNADVLRINTPQYARGIYFVRVEMEGKFLTKKIVIQ